MQAGGNRHIRKSVDRTVRWKFHAPQLSRIDRATFSFDDNPRRRLPLSHPQDAVLAPIEEARLIDPSDAEAD
jgi:hypothetical protein